MWNGSVSVNELMWQKAACQANKDDPTSSFIGTACSECWRPISFSLVTDSTVCECGNMTSEEEVLAAHGLSGLRGWMTPGSGLPRASKRRSEGFDG